MSKRKEAIKALENMVGIQCTDGNWNYDRYMHGMANGLIYALAIVKGVTLKRLEAPKVWLSDRENNSKKPIFQEAIMEGADYNIVGYARFYTCQNDC